MKQTWKKLAGLLLVVICAFALTACGKKETDTFQLITEDMANDCKTTSETVVESLASFGEEQLAQMGQSRDNFTRIAVEEWSEQIKTLGDFKEMGTPKTDIDREAKTITVVIPAQFEKKASNISVVFNYNSDYDQMIPAYMTVTEEESFGGNMKGAGINTLMGVGTVFVVLIFLVFVISLFKVVNKVGTKKTEEEDVQTPAAPVQRAAAPVVEEEDLTDDLELTAVIAAAIAASENTSTDSFVVRSIKKVNRSKWQRA